MADGQDGGPLTRRYVCARAGPFSRAVWLNSHKCMEIVVIIIILEKGARL